MDVLYFYMKLTELFRMYKLQDVAKLNLKLYIHFRWFWNKIYLYHFVMRKFIKLM